MNSTKTVSVSIAGGPSATVPYESDMTALRAIELAQGIIEPDPNEQFTFALQYYGDSLGYLVNMINETYDSFISRGGEKATPFFYWHFLVNNTPSTLSVDRTTLREGDSITFEFQMYSSSLHSNTLLEAKHKYYSR